MNTEIFLEKFNSLNTEGKIDANILNQMYSLMVKLTARKDKIAEGERLGLYPIQNPAAFEKYKQQREMLWPASEVKFDKDKLQFNNPDEISPRQRELFIKIIGFFMPADGAIIENVNSLFMDVDTLEEGLFYIIQLYIETQHAEGYNNAAKAFFHDVDEFNKVKKMVDESVPHQLKLQYIQEYSQSHLPRILRKAASACMEGLFFMGLFPIIFYFIKLEKLPNFTQLNEQIFKDESLHCEFYCSEVKQDLDKISPDQYLEIKEQINSIIKKAVEIEKIFIAYILDQPIIDADTDEQIGITCDNLQRFIEMVADQIAMRCGLPKIYGTIQELSWTEASVMAIKTNKYEKDVTTYSHTEVSSSVKSGRKLRF